MKVKILYVVAALALVVAVLPAGIAGAAADTPPLPIPVDISSDLKHRAAPEQASIEPIHLPSGGDTDLPQCGGDGETLSITIPSFDPAHVEDQEVIFWKESAGDSATLWVAWDYLVTHYGRQDVITCDMLTYLQGTMDDIVDTDVYYFGDYVQRPEGNANIDVMIYNIADESFFDQTFPFYIAGFFWSSLNDAFNRNMIFIDSLDWANRLGPNSSPWRGSDPSLYRENLYEGTVAHELEHLIHSDHDADEDSWIDEGMADLAEYLNGYGHPDGHVVYYLAFHRDSLTIWGGNLEDYGAAYLFQLYLLENFGENDGTSYTGWNNSWTLTEINEQANSITGVENAADTANGGDPPVAFNDLYDSWIVANYMDDASQTGAGGFPVGYDEIDLAPYVSTTYGAWSIERAVTDIYNSDHHGNLPVDRYYGGYVSGTVEYPVGEAAPYGPIYGLYKGFSPEMEIFLRGNANSGVPPHSPTHEMASGGGHGLTDRTLSLLAGQNLPAGGTLSFWTWFDIEEEWDYGFVEISTDSGGTWMPLAGSITRSSSNPNSSSAWANSLLGAAASSNTVITGNSGGWVEATFTLPADDDLMIRFNYYTDEAVNGQGWFIDDVSVNGFSDDFEGGTAAWSIDSWQHTTGLFGNDWIAGYINPVYSSGQFSSLDWSFLDGVIGPVYEYITGVADTSNLNKDEGMAFFANRPGDSPFAAAYLVLIEKGNSK